MTRAQTGLGAAISSRCDPRYLSTPDLAAALGRSVSHSGLRRLRERLHRLGVPYVGPRLRPRWDVEAACTVLGVSIVPRSTEGASRG